MSKLGPTEPWLILDGAHTPGSAAALIHTLRQAFKSLPLGLVVAMAEDKDHPGSQEVLLFASFPPLVIRSLASLIITASLPLGNILQIALMQHGVLLEAVALRHDR